jgi:hypothetical protein
MLLELLREPFLLVHVKSSAASGHENKTHRIGVV